jgi:hypothetical protein
LDVRGGVPADAGGNAPAAPSLSVTNAKAFDGGI